MLVHPLSGLQETALITRHLGIAGLAPEQIAVAPDDGSVTADGADVFSARPADGRRTRIVATLDPEATDQQIRDLLIGGTDVVRLNTAHADPSAVTVIAAAIDRVRQQAQKLERPVAIQIDLPGPKLRLGVFDNPQELARNDISLTKGQRIELSSSPKLGTPHRLPLNVAGELRVGERVFLNDGLVELRITEVGLDDDGYALAHAEVLNDGKTWSRKGVNLPDTHLSQPSITDDDMAILDALATKIDLLAVSFTRSAEDIVQAREQLRRRGVCVPIIAKIERREALVHLEDIAAAADALMVARGDLGVEIGRENVPLVERRINALGNDLGKPTMVATEVLISMAEGSTRASRSEVAALHAAVFDDGAAAVMLAKETSFPKEPGRVVREAALIIRQAEADLVSSRPAA